MNSNVFQENFVQVCSIDDLPIGKGKRFIISGEEVAVFKVNDNVFALNNICPHQHTPIIYDGFLEDNYIVCPSHGWKFNLRTGNQPDGRKGLTSHPVEIRGSEIFVRVVKKRFLR